MNVARSFLFALALILVTPPYAVIALASAPLPRMTRYRIISGWSRLIVWLARVILGIDWRVEGRENLPSRPAIILAKHQSAWETLAFQHIFPPQVHVLKRELLWIPFFGWGLALMSPIAIDRSARRRRAALDRAPRAAAARAGLLGGGLSRRHARRAGRDSRLPAGRRLARRRERRAGGAGGAQCGPVLAA
jgi:1-acyl-sn-glycerol-3-phosphate acyltransferase